MGNHIVKMPVPHFKAKTKSKLLGKAEGIREVAHCTGTNSPKSIPIVNKNSVVAVTKIVPKLGDKNSDVILKCRDGIVIYAHKNVLTEESPYLQRQFADKANVSTNFASEPVLLVLRWIYTGQLVPRTKKKYFEELCQVAKEYELGTHFWNCLETNLMSFFCPREMPAFVRTVQAHKVATPPGLLEKIEYIKKEISYDNRDPLTLCDFVDKWCEFTNLLQDVNCQPFALVPREVELD